MNRIWIFDVYTHTQGASMHGSPARVPPIPDDPEVRYHLSQCLLERLGQADGILKIQPIRALQRPRRCYECRKVGGPMYGDSPSNEASHKEALNNTRYPLSDAGMLACLRQLCSSTQTFV